MAFSAEDIVSDSPTNNFCTLNPLDKGSQVILSNGNLEPTWSGTAGHSVRSNISYPKTGKWYLEVVIGDNKIMGVIDISKPIVPASGSLWPGGNGFGSAGSYAFAPDGTKVSNSVYDSFLSSYSSGSIIKILYDADLGDLKFGIDSGNLTTAYNINTNTTWAFAIGYWGIGGGSNICNFGQDPTFGGTKSPTTTYTDAKGIGTFYFQPPTGALALCTQNLPEMTPDVAGDVPQDYFKTVLYTGQNADSTFIDNGDNTWSKTGVGFQPDLIWAKSRSSATSHALADSVRGPRKILSSNNTTDEYPETSGKTLLSFDSDGFTVGIDGNYTAFTASGSSIVAWCFRAGGPPSGSTSTTGSAKRINTSGTQDDTSCSALATAATNAGASNVITPSLMSINQAAGFSILNYNGTGTAGATFPHGLSSAPEFVIVKQYNTNGFQWMCYHISLGATTGMALQREDGTSPFTSASLWNNTAPTNNVVTLGTHGGDTNNTGSTNIAYCWHSVEGYSKFGSYTGNGSPDGPFVYCGFRPAFVMVKWTSGGGQTTGSWRIMDTARNLYNPATLDLIANEVVTETTYGSDDLDILSNGFKWRSTGSFHNTSGANYIFMAFSEQPFKYANAR